MHECIIYALIILYEIKLCDNFDKLYNFYSIIGWFNYAIQ